MYNFNKIFLEDLKLRLNKYGYVKTDNIFSERNKNKFIDEALAQIKKKNNKKISLRFLDKSSNFIKTFTSNELNYFFQYIFDQDFNINSNSFFCMFSYNNSNEIILKKKNINKFHFDGYLYTIIMPININGMNDIDTSMYLFPLLREKFKFFLLGNFFIKLFFQNLFINKFINILVIMKFLNPTKIELKQNEILIFNGYNSLHAGIDNINSKIKCRLILHIFEDKNISKFERFLNERNKNRKRN